MRLPSSKSPPRRRSRNRFQSIPNIPRQPAPLWREHPSNTIGSPPFRSGLLDTPELAEISPTEQFLETSDPSLPSTEVQLRSTCTDEDNLEEEEDFGEQILGIEPEQSPPDSEEEITEDPRAIGSTQALSGTSELSALSVEVRSVSTLLIPSWRVIWGLLMTAGSTKMTKVMYQAMRTIAETFANLKEGAWNKTEQDVLPQTYLNSRMACLPHFSTLNRVFRPLVLNTLAPRAIENFEHMDERKAGARPVKCSPEGQPMAKVRVILPSEYVRADLATGPVFRAMRSTSLEATRSSTADEHTCAITAEECVDIWPVVCARELFYGPEQTISLDYCRNSNFDARFAERGDCICVEAMGSDSLSSELLSAFSGEGVEDSERSVRGVVVAIWTVHHASRRNVPGFDSYPHEELSIRDRAIYTALNFVPYSSPTDSIHVEIPLPEAIESESEESDEENEQPKQRKKKSDRMSDVRRERRTALRNRQNQIQNAWNNWQKPLLKPGDVVALLRPTYPYSTPFAIEQMSRSHSDARICLVHRFWRENEEKSRHILWIPSSVVLPDASRDQGDPISSVCIAPNSHDSRNYRDVFRTILAKAHGKPRGTQRFKPVSSFGKLDNGENYAIYRFLLFWDGFQISEGKSASGEGIYLLCLNLPLQSRSCPNAVRIISFTSPGVNVDAVFKRIRQDIVSGMAEGFMEIDAEGQKRRIFLDLVGVVGDTPALNAVLDVLGHTSTSCCHLCTYIRGSTSLVGTRYTRSGFDGTRSHLSRRYLQHTAVRDCRPGAATYKLLGMKNLEDESSLPLHRLRQAMWEVKNRIPKTSTGVKILSGDLDPYRAAFVGPDHLLSGHIRDFLNLAFRVLPSSQHRKSCEAFLIGLLSECRLPSQNRVYDHEKRKIFSMSMSELFALILVAGQGFLFGYAHADHISANHSPMSEHCRSAVALLQSCSLLVAGFWYLPLSSKDGADAVASFNSNFGYDTLARLQSMTEDHLQRVEQLCAMDDEDVCEMEDAECGKRRRVALSKEHNLRLQAIKAIDKPNLHRLRELVYTTLPMMGHVSRVGELILERAHQTLKRGIRQSNNKEPHLQALKSSVFNDWQGRLSLLAHSALSGDHGALLGCYRLLAGREAVRESNGRLQAHQITQIRQAIGPESCVPAQLNIQRMAVISKSTSDPLHISWKFEGSPERGADRSAFSTAQRRYIYDLFTSAFSSHLQVGEIEIGDCIISASQLQRRTMRFQHGDVFETSCVRPEDDSFHNPFVILSNALRPDLLTNMTTGVRFWFVISFLKLDRASRHTDHFAAVVPCRKLPRTAARASPGYTIPSHTPSAPLPVSFIRVTTSLHCAAVFHNCTPLSCAPVPHRGVIQHCGDSSPLQGGSFYIKSRKEGYPPRQG